MELIGLVEAGILPWLSTAVGKRLQEKIFFDGFCELEQQNSQANKTVHMYKSSNSHVT